MKLKHYFSGALLVGLMASCSNNDLPDTPGQILENETTTYVRVSIIGSPGTRAEEDGYTPGTADESVVDKILLVFFDAGRNYVGKTEVSGDVKGEDDEYDIDFNGTGNTVERVLTVVATVELPENINYPKYVIAYVNPTSLSGDLGSEALDDATTYIRPRNTISPNGYRTMNNSVYFNEGTRNSRYATEVDFKNQFYKTKAEAMAATANSVEIVVERMEAKIQLNNIASISQDNPFKSDSQTTSGKEYTLTFVPEAWFVNGIEKNSFLLKNYRNIRQNYTASLASVPTLFDLTSLNNAFNRGSDFSVNDYTNKRSYWAIDPTYFYDVAGDPYPSVSYDVKYTDEVEEVFNSSGNENFPLYYYSFKDKVKEYNKAESSSYIKFDKDKIKTHEYVTENTLSYNTLRSTDAKAAMTSVVLCGHYIVKDNAGNVVFDGSEYNLSDEKKTSAQLQNALTKAFYVRHEADGKRFVMINENEAIDFFLERSGSTLYVQTRNEDGSLKANSFEPLRASHLDNKKVEGIESLYGVSHSDFELIYPGTNITNGSKLSEQWRTISFVKKDGKYNENLYVYDASYNDNKGGYKKISALSEDEMDAFDDRMYSTFGVLEKFQAGKAYFNVPLKHIWANLTSSSNTYEPDKVKLGDYGVVRNHVYDLTINSISGLGTGIGDVNQPIVPPTENERYYVSTKLKILKWKIVSQNVDL